jgi:4-alpha-glucanotransferase
MTDASRASRQKSDLERAAERIGLATRYVDAAGNEVIVPENTLAALIQVLSVRGEARPASTESPPADPDPRESYQGSDPSERNWLLAVQLYSIRSRSNWGHGDFTDLMRLIELAAELGAAGIGLNPLHALMYDGDMNGSPYSPSSRLFLNFLYIDVEAIPAFKAIESGEFLARAEALRSQDKVDYPAVVELKQAALRRCFERDQAAGQDADFEDFRAERGASLRKFASFSAGRRVQADESHFEDEVRFEEYVQWHADRQLRACVERGKALRLSVGLYLDLAVGVCSDGADAQTDREAHLERLTVGAPPDLLNVRGQDWGLTTYHPVALIERDLAPFRAMLAANMRYAGALRLDHVMWLNRLYIIPRGVSAAEGSYIRYPLPQLLSTLTDESNAHRCIVIGEDLGTVPPELREELRRWGVWTYHVMQFEREESGQFKSADKYQARALATFSTHDLPPFAAWFAGSDLEEKHAIGIDPGETDEDRNKAKELLASALNYSGGKPDELFLEIAAFLARTRSRLVVVSLEDALGLSYMTNIPGTTHEHPNWRTRLPINLEDLATNRRLRRLADVFVAAGRGRSPN